MRTITVKGVGNIFARADSIEIDINFETTDTDYEKLGLTIAKKVKAIYKTIIDLGYKKEDIKTTNFKLFCRHRYPGKALQDHQREFDCFVCSHSLKLSFDFDSKRLAAVISALGGCGVKLDLDIHFTLKNPMKVHEELLISATQNATAKATILCQAAGTQLGQLLSINYDWNELDIISQTNFDIGKRFQFNCPAPEIEPEDIAVSDCATFVWEIL